MNRKVFALAAFLFFAVLVLPSAFALQSCAFAYDLGVNGQFNLPNYCGMNLNQKIEFKYPVPERNYSVTVFSLRLIRFNQNKAGTYLPFNDDSWSFLIENDLFGTRGEFVINEDTTDSRGIGRGIGTISIYVDSQSADFASQIERLTINFDSRQIYEQLNKRVAEGESSLGELVGFGENFTPNLPATQGGQCQPAYTVPSSGKFRLPQPCTAVPGQQISFMFRQTELSSPVELFVLRYENIRPDSLDYWYDNDLLEFSVIDRLTGQRNVLNAEENQGGSSKVGNYAGVFLNADTITEAGSIKVKNLNIEIYPQELSGLTSEFPGLLEQVSSNKVDEKTKAVINAKFANDEAADDSEGIAVAVKDSTSKTSGDAWASSPPKKGTYVWAWQLEGATIQQLNDNKEKVTIKQEVGSEFVETSVPINVSSSFKDTEGNDVVGAFYLVEFRDAGKYRVLVEGQVVKNLLVFVKSGNTGYEIIKLTGQ